MKTIKNNYQKDYTQQAQGSGAKIVTKSKPVLITLFSVFVLSLTLSIFMLFNPVFIAPTNLTSNAIGDTIHTDRDGNVVEFNLRFFTFFCLSVNDINTSTLTGSVITTTVQNLAIPESIGHDGVIYNVTEIGVRAFSDKVNLTGTITIPKEILIINNSAFSGCTGLTGLQFSEDSKLTCIGSSAFSGCCGLTGLLTIPNSVTIISNSAFRDCSGLTGNLLIPDNVTEIGSYAFFNCISLTGNLIIPNSVTRIGESAYMGCSELNGDLTIGNNVESIELQAFLNCSKLKSLVFASHSKLTCIGSFAFSRCTGLTGSLTIPNSVTDIGENAFYDCNNLDGNLVIGNKVTIIGPRAFYGCKNLTGDLIIPNSVTSIDFFTFYNCIGLTSLTIPNGVESIGNSAFSFCSKLTSIKIGDGVTNIGNSAFFGCRGLTSLTIPNSVTNIGSFAFSSCSGLTSISMGNGVTEISANAFNSCDSAVLASTYLPTEYATGFYEWYKIRGGTVGSYTYDDDDQFTSSPLSLANLEDPDVPSTYIAAYAKVIPNVANTVTITKGTANLYSDMAVIVQSGEYVSMFIFSKNKTSLNISLLNIPQGTTYITFCAIGNYAVTATIGDTALTTTTIENNYKRISFVNNADTNLIVDLTLPSNDT